MRRTAASATGCVPFRSATRMVSPSFLISATLSRRSFLFPASFRTPSAGLEAMTSRRAACAKRLRSVDTVRAATPPPPVVVPPRPGRRCLAVLPAAISACMPPADDDPAATPLSVSVLKNKGLQAGWNDAHAKPTKLSIPEERLALRWFLKRVNGTLGQLVHTAHLRLLFCLHSTFRTECKH